MDTTVIKIDSSHSPRGSDHQAYLASGVRIGMRLWQDESPSVSKDTVRDYEVVGYVLHGRAELHCEGQMVTLAPGDSWVVPRGATHHYRILDTFTAIEATSPPSHVHGRDLARDDEPSR